VITYNVYRKAPTGFDLLDSITEKSYDDTNLTNGWTYSYKVAAINEVGVGAMTMLNATPGRVPDAPSDLTVNAARSKAVLNWNAPTYDGGLGVTEYWIYRGSSKDNMERIGTSKNTTFEDFGLTAGKEYHYQVVAVNKAGESAPSETVTLKLDVTAGMESLYLLLVLFIVLAVTVVMIVVFKVRVLKKKL
jgi:fibronectin type 3 domain-containing protein